MDVEFGVLGVYHSGELVVVEYLEFGGRSDLLFTLTSDHHNKKNGER